MRFILFCVADSVRKEDKGMYQCFVRNEQESAQASAELKLGGRCELLNLSHVFKIDSITHDFC